MLTCSTVIVEATVAAVAEATLLTDELASSHSEVTTDGLIAAKGDSATVIFAGHMISGQAVPFTSVSSQHVSLWLIHSEPWENDMKKRKCARP
jgi:hypothetical protein